MQIGEIWGALAMAGILVVVLGGAPGAPLAQGTPALEGSESLNPYPLRPSDTSSPRATLRSFQENAREAIRRFQSQEPIAAVDRARARVRRTLDVSELPPAGRDEQLVLRGLMLVEILDRIELPLHEEIPDVAAIEATGLTSWTIPNTEITIARTEEGPYAGEFQFTARTVEQLPAFYEWAKHLPYKPGALVGVFEDLSYAPGPWLPLEWTEGLPEFAYAVLFGHTVWQWLGALATLGLAAAIVAVAYLLGGRLDAVGSDTAPRRHAGRVIATLVTIVTLHLTGRFLDDGIHILGVSGYVLELALRMTQVAAIGWLILLILNAIGEAIIRARASRPDAVDTHLIRIVVRVLAIIVLVYLALYLAEWFGIPAAPLIASLGVGGLAIALAVRPTMENIVGGFILFADKPVRVGEFCTFGDKMGTIEQIGLRSTRVRALDRTVITVPNSDFAQMQIVNFTRRDQMLLRTTLGLRYETTPEQLRYVLTKLRELFVAHPRISPEPARARFTGFGDFSLNVEIFAYVLSDDYNEFLAIAEDVNLRIIDIVADAGTGFAFPSQTAYLARDHGLDAERARSAEAEVQAWRADGALPFPALDPERVQALDGTLDYPPTGSAQDRHTAAVAEPAPAAAKAKRWGFGRSRPDGGP